MPADRAADDLHWSKISKAMTDVRRERETATAPLRRRPKATAHAPPRALTQLFELLRIVHAHRHGAWDVDCLESGR
jgi:hypothetical protein